MEKHVEDWMSYPQLEKGDTFAKLGITPAS
jgi:hypothetical protein